MNEIRLKGTLKFPARTFAAGVGIVVQVDGENGGIDCTAWTNDAPEAVAALAACGQGSKVSILGKLTRGKARGLSKVADGAIVPGDVWELKVSVLKVRVDAAVAAPPLRNEPPPTSGDDSLPF